MEACIFCVLNHLGRADGYIMEARAGYEGRLGKALGQLALAEEEAPAGELRGEIRAHRKAFEAQGLQYDPHLEQLMGKVEKMLEEADPDQRKTSPVDATKRMLPFKDPGGEGCADCVKKARERALGPAKSLKSTQEPGHAPVSLAEPPEGLPQKLVLLTALSDFDPSYSLVTVILDQATAAIEAGLEVDIVGMKSMGTERPESGAQYIPAITDVGWEEDEYDQKKVDSLVTDLQALLHTEGPCIILTHDLLFQSWYLSFAAAIHHLAATGQWGAKQGYHWYHQMHSSVGHRPPHEVAKYRASVPTGHRMVSINYTDIPNLARYYGTETSKFSVIPNIRDACKFFGVSEQVKFLVQTLSLDTAEVVQIYPVSIPRAKAKGVPAAIKLFGSLKQYQGKDVRLVLAAAHTTGNQEMVNELHEMARLVGLEEHEFAITSDENLLPETRSVGLSVEDIHGLMHFSNLFCFPSSSEACGLVMLEAALSGCFLVLNDDLPVLKDFIQPQQALWVPWGSIHTYRPPEVIEAATHQAAQAISTVLSTPRYMAKREIQSKGLSYLTQSMKEVWGLA